MPAPNIAQTKTVHAIEEIPLPKFTGTGSSAQIAWTAIPASAGTFSPSQTANGQATTFTPSNESRDAVIQARDTGDNATAATALEVQATFPYEGDWNTVPRDLDDKTNVSFAADGSESMVVKSGAFRSMAWTFPDREHAEWEAAETFWLHHRKTRYFWLKDTARSGAGASRRYWVRFDSKFPDDPGGANKISYSLIFREKPPPPPPPT